MESHDAFLNDFASEDGRSKTKRGEKVLKLTQRKKILEVVESHDRLINGFCGWMLDKVRDIW